MFVPNFEERPQQMEMALSVWKALINGQHLLVEAGTGIGKSLAYLFPAVLWSQLTKKRIIVSTHTVNLQQQLVHKDLPLLNKIFKQCGFNFNYALFKGRNHYLCLRRWNQVYGQTTQLISLVKPNEKEITLEKLSDFMKSGFWDGDRDRLLFPVSDSVWSEICSESGRCMFSKCPYKDDCFYQKHRKYLEKCHLIVVNHALFVSHLKIFQDSAGKINLLPGFEGVILDEAHHFENVTRNSLASEISYFQFKRLADDTLRLASNGSLGNTLSKDEVRRIRVVLEDKLATLDSILKKLDPEIYGQTNANGNGKKRSNRKASRCDGKREKTRLRETGLIDEKFIKSLEDFLHVLGRWPELDLSDEERFEVNALQKRYISFINDLKSINCLDGDGESFVYWAENSKGPRYKTVVLKRSPLEVGPYLEEALWSAIPSAILTSATLSAGGTFNYIKQMLSLSDAKQVILGSPFDYCSQACLCVPKDSHSQDPNSQSFYDYVAKKVIEIVDMVLGRTFVLFTSKKSLESVARLVRDKIEERGYPVLIQGEAPREILLAEFKTTGNAVLFGLDSFWEGVDVPGDALSCVILAKLPFPVPDDPVLQAREELWKSLGKIPFIQYSLPQAIIKLKQGFGRLIRTKTDKGAVVILDPRIITKHYGKSIIKSLPPVRLTSDIEEVARAVPPPRGNGTCSAI